MGYLHEGHASLMEAAVEASDVGVASVFVNPLQFGEGEDLSTYPRDLERDAALAEACGVAYLFTPGVEEMYPRGPVETSVHVDALADRWEGATRPGHFAGMATVVTKLFAIVGPCRAYFGEKDYQQLAIIRRFVEDLSLPIDVVGCPTVRAEDGLALSSRNAYLEPPERAAATVLYRALTRGGDLIRGGETNPATVVGAMTDIVSREPLAELDYAAVVDASSLATPDLVDATCRLLIAAQVGRPRLIDNIGVDPEEGPS